MTDRVWVPNGRLSPNIVARAQAGERAAEEAAVRRAMELATRTAAPLVGADLAAEVAQNVGLQVLRSLRRLREPASFDRWVHRITEHRVHDLYRRRARWRGEQASLNGHLSDDPRNDEDSAASAARDALAAALSRLGRRQRTVIALYYVHDLPVEEIARIIRARRGTVASLLSRARASLRADPSLRAALGYAPMMEERNV